MTLFESGVVAFTEDRCFKCQFSFEDLSFELLSRRVRPRLSTNLRFMKFPLMSSKPTVLSAAKLTVERLSC